MYKLIAIDLDGTTLNSYGEVSEKTKRVIRETIKKGINVIIASGRTMDSIETISNEIGSNQYLIAGNGAVIYDMQNKKNIYEKYLPKKKAIDIIKICEENSITYSVYTNKAIIADTLKYNILYYYKENLKKEENKRTNIKIVSNIYDYVTNMEEEKILKIIICDKAKPVFNSILRKVKSIEDIEILEVSHMSRKLIKSGTEEVPIEYYYTEITDTNVDKWYAIEYLMTELHIKKEEVIAIGDNMNDKKMIENAGIGVAMKGSTPNVTEVADFITEEDNNNDGVANIIEQIIK